MKRSNVVAYLQDISEVELIKLFYEVVQPRRIEYTVESDGRKVVDTALVVARTVFLDGGDDSTGVEVVALPPLAYKAESSDTLCQSGRCERCKVLVVGYVKEGTCPICLSEVLMT